ncbi:MAG: efflux RND transporter periplasmic adaptor subunit [Bacteroidetes bacterium]|nr:efflux RND transporter periplasmic adaptor subunit [Bacteroidota bacterium]MDA0972494.1 efflux RND transporter periplasmic adaptor subunit [Bacteroidota bacterium]
MKQVNKKIILIGAATLLLGFLLGRMMNGSSATEQPTTEVEDATIWTCSMHPQIRQAEPGNCPICGMELIPVSGGAEEEGSDMDIRMSPTAMQLADVRTMVVGSDAASMDLRLNGKVQVDERKVHSQSSHISGRLEELNIDFIGEQVRKGAQVGRIYSPDLVTAQEELLEAERMQADYPQLLEAAKSKLRNWKMSDTQIDAILERGEASGTLPIYADQGGVVLKKKVNEGDYVSQGGILYEVADLSGLWILFDVYEQDMSWVKIGSEVTFQVASLPGEDFTAKIDFIDPVIDAKTRVAKARISFQNSKGRLKPEMFVTGLVSSPVGSKESKLTVPKSAVMWTGERSVVYVRTPSDKGVSFQMREVRLGLSMGDSYVIEEGLESGEEIAFSGTFSIDAAAQLAGKASMMNPEGGKVMTGHDHGGGTVPTAPISSNKGVSVVSSTKESKAQIATLIENYLTLKDALVSDDFENAKKDALALKASIASVDMSAFQGDAHGQWMSAKKELDEILEHAAHFSDIAQIRSAFKPLSAQMISLTKTFDPMKEKVYEDFCPMADQDRGGNWLSLEKEIRNPYFGSKMMKCGSIVEEID